LSPAETEFRAICALQRAGIPTMQAVCFGHEWGAWGARRSYVIVARVPGEALERCGASLLEALRTRPGSRGDFTRRLAHLVRTFHETGFVHRDLYASHIFVDPSTDPISLHLIDLARAFRPWLRRFRWRVKDLAQLKFSAPEPWVRADWRAFLRLYLGPGGTRSLSGLDRAVDAKVASICRRRERKRRREGAKRA
jgi:heptose I phosphotransferase